MIHATSRAVLIAWDMGLGPTFQVDGTRAHALYRVYRDGATIGDTHAEAFYDTHVRRGAVYTYRVFAVGQDGSESAVGPSFTVHVPRAAPGDRVAPTVPEDLTTAGWTPSSDSSSGVLAYFVERDSGPQPWAVLWNPDGTLHEWTDESAVKEPYRLRALDGALNLSEPSSIATATGWTIYTYKASEEFLLKAGTSVKASVFWAGGGGSGGGGYQGGGGSGGGFVDKHDVLIVHADDDPEAGDGETVLVDGAVVVGSGGAAVAFRETATDANKGGDSSFGGVTAYGGGYGSGQWGPTLVDGAYLDEPDVYYHASDGASGGGGGPWPGEGEDSHPVVAGESTEDWTYSPYMIWHGHGTKGRAVHNEGEGTGPYEPFEQMWNYETTKDFGPQPQGHDGKEGDGYTSWYQRTASGGGGANWPAVGFGGDGIDGGLGRPCDIAGWPLWEETGREFKFIPWFCGGGAGKERPNNWSFPDGRPGYGGGGACGADGAPNTGGGGGGNGALATGHIGDAPSCAGGSGVVIVRIATVDERHVEYPVPLRYEDVWDADFEAWVSTPVYPDHIHVTHIGEDELHLDEMGDELVQINDYPQRPYNHYGWDGKVMAR